MQTDTLDIHPTTTWVGGSQQHGTNVSTGTLLEYERSCWYFMRFFTNGDVTLVNMEDRNVSEKLSKEKAQGLKIL